MSEDIEYRPRIHEDWVTNFCEYVIDESCHLINVEVFARDEDARDGKHITVGLDGSVKQDTEMKCNPSRRRTGIVLHFWSEVNQPPWDNFVMCIFQHKGNEYVKFMHQTDYILTNGGNRGY